MTEVSTRELLQELAAQPIGDRELCGDHKYLCGPEGIGAAKRASKIFLPAGKRSASSRESRAERKALAECQIDIEDAIEAAGGHRGTIGVH